MMLILARNDARLERDRRRWNAVAALATDAMLCTPKSESEEKQKGRRQDDDAGMKEAYEEE